MVAHAVDGERAGTHGKTLTLNSGRVGGVSGCAYCVAFERNDKSSSRQSKKNYAIGPSLHTCTSARLVRQKMIETLCFCVRIPTYPRTRVVCVSYIRSAMIYSTVFEISAIIGGGSGVGSGKGASLIRLQKVLKKKNKQ